MKVKFLKAGRWAPENQQESQFNFEVDDVKSGISEKDVVDMKKAGIAELIGTDDVDIEDEDEENGDNEEPKSETITSESMSGKSEKPWANNNK